MKRKSNVDPKSRRGFLKELAAAGGAVAVASVASPAVAEPALEKPRTTDEPDGYQVTDHVKAYYDKARF